MPGANGIQAAPPPFPDPPADRPDGAPDELGDEPPARPPLDSMRMASAIRLINLCGACSLWARRASRSSSVNTIAVMEGLYTCPPFRTRTRKHPDERPSDNRTRNQGDVTLLITGHRDKPPMALMRRVPTV